MGIAAPEAEGRAPPRAETAPTQPQACPNPSLHAALFCTNPRPRSPHIDPSPRVPEGANESNAALLGWHAVRMFQQERETRFRRTHPLVARFAPVCGRVPPPNTLLSADSRARLAGFSQSPVPLRLISHSSASLTQCHASTLTHPRPPTHQSRFCAGIVEARYSAAMRRAASKPRRLLNQHRLKQGSTPAPRSERGWDGLKHKKPNRLPSHHHPR